MKADYAQTSSGRIHLVHEGSGRATVLLHGFPEFWFAWRDQIPAIAAAGYRAIAPDLRGYNLSHKPREVAAYKMGCVADELAEFVRVVAPGERVVLVGHDWGAVMAWLVTMRAPELVERLVILNVPHPTVVRRALRRFDQLLRFWYQFLVQPPLIPELCLRAGNFALLEKSMRRLSKRPEALTPEVMADYRKAWGQPGALEAMLHYYRAQLRRGRGGNRRRAGASTKIACPTLLVHGELDPFFARDLFDATGELVPDLLPVRIPSAGHFVQQDEPEMVTRLILEFVTQR